MRWGIPYGKVHSNNQQAINARSENIIEGAGMWNKYRGSSRCIVVSQGYVLFRFAFLANMKAKQNSFRYYEWQTKGKDKIPHFTTHADGRLMLMAGLYHAPGAYLLITVCYIYYTDDLKTRSIQGVASQ